MCSYKLVSVSFDVWALASRVESYVHKVSLSATLYNNKLGSDGNVKILATYVQEPDNALKDS